MIILAIDCSTEAMSVALYQQGQTLQRFHHQPQQQAKLLLPETEALLADADISLSQIDAIAFAKGPGSFTGLRVAVAAVQAMAVAADKPVVALSTLLSLAYGEYRRTGQTDILTCLDARMHEVYFARYQFVDHGHKILNQDCVLPPEQVQLDNLSGLSFAGNGWSVYADKFSFTVPDEVLAAKIAWPEAQDLATLAAVEYDAGHLLSAEQALPVYIRDNVAAKPKALIK